MSVNFGFPLSLYYIGTFVVTSLTLSSAALPPVNLLLLLVFQAHGSNLHSSSFKHLNSILM